MAAKKAAVPSTKKIKSTAPYTLAIDIGGTGLKASILDAQGKMTHERVRIPTPANCPPMLMLTKLKELIVLIPATIPKFDRISVGFPGVVRAGKIYTAHNLGTMPWVNFDLANALKKQFGKPCRVLNDADLQGLAAINQLGGKGVEMVITLGTGLGSSLFENGRLLPHMEFAHHPFRQDETYEEQIGDVAREQVGKKRWNKRVKLAIEALHNLMNFDRLSVEIRFFNNVSNISL